MNSQELKDLYNAINDLARDFACNGNVSIDKKNLVKTYNCLMNAQRYIMNEISILTA